MDKPRRVHESDTQTEESADDNYLNVLILTLGLGPDEEESRQREDAEAASQHADADDNMIHVAPHRRQLLRSLFRTPDSSLTSPRILKRYGIVSLQDDDVLHGGPPFILDVPFSSLVRSFVPGLVHFMESLTFLFVARYPSRVILACSSR